MKYLGKTFNTYIILIIFIKVLFVIFAIIERYYKLKVKQSLSASSTSSTVTQQYALKYNWAIYWKNRLEFLFVISMAIVCIIVFYPFYSDTVFIDKHTRILLFVYGFIILLTANWSIIDKLPPWFIQFQNLIGKGQQNSTT